MSRIVLITHAYDDFRRRKFLLGSLARHWVQAGHEVNVTAGLGDWPDADVAVMHLDLSVVPAAYSQASRRYPAVVNAAATDIRKRRVSRLRVTPDDGWTGPVIVKTDLNCRGMPELRAIDGFRRDGRPADLQPGAIVTTRQPYPVLRSARDVPDAVWRDDGLVVERFLPERDARGYWMRVWVFFGERERCSRYCAAEPVVKSAQILARETISVPDELRAERERLGFDYGKFDFVLVGGKAVLLDANRTPSAPPPSADMDASNAHLAGALDALLRDSR